MRMHNWNMHGVADRRAYAERIHSVADSGCEPASWIADCTFYMVPTRFRLVRLQAFVTRGISFS